VEVLEDRTAPAVLGGTISPVVQNWAQSLQAATVPAQQFTPSAAQVIQNPVGTGTGSGLPGLQGAVPAFANFAQARVFSLQNFGQGVNAFLRGLQQNPTAGLGGLEQNFLTSLASLQQRLAATGQGVNLSGVFARVDQLLGLTPGTTGGQFPGTTGGLSPGLLNQFPGLADLVAARQATGTVSGLDQLSSGVDPTTFGQTSAATGVGADFNLSSGTLASGLRQSPMRHVFSPSAP